MFSVVFYPTISCGNYMYHWFQHPKNPTIWQNSALISFDCVW